MAGLNETPGANRVHTAFFGLRNVGKSTLVNAFTGQQIAIVSGVAGTTTDPVSKAMETLPLGPCVVTDTAGLDDEGDLGRQRVEKSMSVLATTDIAVWVSSGRAEPESPAHQEFLRRCRQASVKVLEYRRGDSVEDLKGRIAAVKIADATPGLLDGLVKRGDRVLCVCPIDESAPKGRLILPQVQVIRACLDIGATAMVCQPDDLPACFAVQTSPFDLVVTDSQAFGKVAASIPATQRLTSFSILFARQKGDIASYVEGLSRLKTLQDGDTVLIAEGCTHHRQCNDIGSVKIPMALERLTGRRLRFRFSSGVGFETEGVSLVVQCGGCMLTRREVMRRIALMREKGLAIVNYGMVLAQAAGLDLNRCELV